MTALMTMITTWMVSVVINNKLVIQCLRVSIYIYIGLDRHAAINGYQIKTSSKIAARGRRLSISDINHNWYDCEKPKLLFQRSIPRTSYRKSAAPRQRREHLHPAKDVAAFSSSSALRQPWRTGKQSKLASLAVCIVGDTY